MITKSEVFSVGFIVFSVAWQPAIAVAGWVGKPERRCKIPLDIKNYSQFLAEKDDEALEPAEPESSESVELKKKLRIPTEGERARDDACSCGVWEVLAADQASSQKFNAAEGYKEQEPVLSAIDADMQEVDAQVAKLFDAEAAVYASAKALRIVDLVEQEKPLCLSHEGAKNRPWKSAVETAEFKNSLIGMNALDVTPTGPPPDVKQFLPEFIQDGSAPGSFAPGTKVKEYLVQLGNLQRLLAEKSKKHGLPVAEVGAIDSTKAPDDPGTKAAMKAIAPMNANATGQSKSVESLAGNFYDGAAVNLIGGSLDNVATIFAHLGIWVKDSNSDKTGTVAMVLASAGRTYTPRSNAGPDGKLIKPDAKMGLIKTGPSADLAGTDQHAEIKEQRQTSLMSGTSESVKLERTVQSAEFERQTTQVHMYEKGSPEAKAFFKEMDDMDAQQKALNESRKNRPTPTEASQGCSAPTSAADTASQSQNNANSLKTVAKETIEQ